ncbi:MAG: hypothetical protein ABJE47_23290, partial [bacterium]
SVASPMKRHGLLFAFYRVGRTHYAAVSRDSRVRAVLLLDSAFRLVATPGATVEPMDEFSKWLLHRRVP